MMYAAQSEIAQALRIAENLRSDLSSLDELLPKSRRGSRVQKVMDMMQERLHAINLCLKDADAHLDDEHCQRLADGERDG